MERQENSETERWRVNNGVAVVGTRKMGGLSIRGCYTKNNIRRDKDKLENGEGGAAYKTPQRRTRRHDHVKASVETKRTISLNM